MQEEFLDYQKYKWFYTSSGKLVVGGKSSIQNDELLKKLKRQNKDYVVMHTSSPGSPFSIILAPIKQVSQKDIEQTAIFTGCFSRAWREKKKMAQIDIFHLSQLYKSKLMKTGTWGVKGKIQRKVVELSLVLTLQNEKLRAVPESVPKKKDILLKIKPGKTDKRTMLPKFHVLLPDGLTQEAVLSALPAGGVSISKNK
jgi:hypothetical protein